MDGHRESVNGRVLGYPVETPFPFAAVHESDSAFRESTLPQIFTEYRLIHFFFDMFNFPPCYRV